MKGYNQKQTNSQPIESAGLRLPDSRGLECQVLADIIANPEMAVMVRGIVNRDMFTNQAFQNAWLIINDMLDKGTTVDVATVCSRIDNDTLFAIMEPTPAFTYEATMDHCRALWSMSTRRLVFSRCYEIMSMAGDPGTDLSNLISQPGRLVDELAGRTRAGTGTQTVADVLKDFAYELQDRADGAISRVPTGFPRLDGAILGGWTGGNLIVLSARPSVGKSALMLQMALSATRAGFPATVYSLEMPNRDLGQRLVLSTGEVAQRDIATDQAIQSLDISKVDRANRHFDNLPLQFNTRLRSLDEICNDITLQHQRGRCSIAFIDHLHIISGGDNRLSFYQAISERTRRFKLLAMDCGIPVVLLCQLNRMSEMDNRPPELRDLRDSGSIEQDADIVLMLARHTNTLMDPDVDMWIRKNRNGRAGVCVQLAGDVQRGFNVFTEREPD